MSFIELFGLEAKLDGIDWVAVEKALETGENVNEVGENGTPHSWNFNDAPYEVFALAYGKGLEVDSMLLTRLVEASRDDLLKFLIDKDIAFDKQPEVDKDYSAMGGSIMSLVPFMGLTKIFGKEDSKAEEIAQLLLENGADVNARDSAGRTALFTAAIADNVSLIEFLLAHGADKSHKDVKGKTAFDSAPAKAQCRKLLK